MKKISREELEKLYNEMPNKELCKILGVSHATLIKYLRASNIELKGMGNRDTSTKVKLIIE